MEEIESLLLAQKARIEKHVKELDSASINLTTHRKQFRGGTSSTQGFFNLSFSSQYNHSNNNFQISRERYSLSSRNSSNRSFTREEGTPGIQATTADHNAKCVAKQGT